MKFILHSGYKTRHKGAVYASPMAMLSYCMWEQSSTKTYQVMYMLLEVYSVLLLIRFIDQSKTRDRPYVRILTEKCSTFHAVPLNIWSKLLLIKTKKSGLPGCKYREKYFYFNYTSKSEFCKANWHVLAMFCYPIY